MKVKVNDEELFELSEVQKKVICNDIPSDILEDDMKRRLKYIIHHKYERCLERLKNEWIPKLKKRGVPSIPLDDDELANLIFSQQDYKGRKEKEIRTDEKRNRNE